MDRIFVGIGMVVLLGVLSFILMTWADSNGYRHAQAECVIKAQSSLARQTDETLKRERQVAATLAEARQELENEKEHAKVTINNMRSELSRVRQYAAYKSSPGSMPHSAETTDAPNETATNGWQLFGQCAEKYATMAEVADNQLADLKEWQAYGKAVNKIYK